ncbi:MAG: hypothetical protein COS92_04110 [Desulfobacterales bacterium CG07_land_8_20_14_0_80_52_14]|nr:MAG: hypothetical protein COS92_04110 [Desulfobacterales bacterium CG07_land_8_20_14_0_80_52_14]
MPDEAPLDIRDCRTHLLFKVYVLPRSSKNAFAGRHLDALKVKLMAPPVEGEANRVCIDFLSRKLKIPKSSLAIVSGMNGRTKRIRFDPAGQTDAKTEICRIKDLLFAFVSPEKTA